MVDDDGNAKERDLQEFADLCYKISQKFYDLDIIEKSFQGLND